MKNLARSLISLIFLFTMLLFAYQQTRAPDASSDSDLDYNAITKHIEVIADTPHPMGSDANRRVRDYIVHYFESLGLQTEVQEATVVYRHPSRSNQSTIIANVENIIARLPGRNANPEGSRNDLVVMAHYDSRPLTPGAADDASGVAAIMEVARLMVNDPTPEHDVVFLITDGEEMGLLGAQGFFRQHPAAQRVGLVLNFEARGSTAASSMFETSDKNAWLVKNLIDAVPDLVAGSLSYEIYRRMPNDTDMSISKGEGIAGLNFGYVGGLFDYHAMTDNAQNLDKNSLAQQSNYVLAGARHFANLKEWRSGSGDLTYFNLVTGVLLSYSQATAIVSGVLVLALGLWVLIIAVRKKTLDPGSVASGLLAAVVLLLIVNNVFESLIGFQQGRADGIARIISLGEWPLAAYFISTLGICAWFSSAVKGGFSDALAWALPLVLAALSLVAGRPWPVALALILILAPALLYLNRRRHTPDLWAGGLMLWWVFTALVLYFAANAAYLLVWPLLAVSLGFFLHQKTLKAQREPYLTPVLVVSAIPLLLLSPIIIMAYLALGSTMPQMIMIITVLSLLLIWPLVQSIGAAPARSSGFLLMGIGLLMSLVFMFDRNFNQRYPAEESLFLAMDIDNNKAYWASLDARPGSWSDHFLGENAGSANLSDIVPGYDENVRISEVQPERVEPASLEKTGDELIDGRRQINLRLSSPERAEYINLLFPVSLNISSAMVNGLPVTVPAASLDDNARAGKNDVDKNRDKTNGSQWWRWRWYGLPEQGADILLVLEPDKAVTVRVVEVDYGMPPTAPQRPSSVMPRKYTWSDSRVIYQTISVD